METLATAKHALHLATATEIRHLNAIAICCRLTAAERLQICRA